MTIERLPRTLHLSLAGLLLLTVPLGFAAAARPRTETQKIEALIQGLESLKGATFLRNGSGHDAKTAAGFLRKKWRAHGDAVRSAGDFIDKIASASSTTGQPYRIRFADGRELLCGAYLKEELKKLEGAP